MATKKKNPKDKKKVGRKHKSLKQRLEKRTFDYDAISRMAEEGMTDAQIANVVGVKRKDTIADWRREDPEFADALKKGKEISDSRVVKSLYKRTQGYEYEEVTTEVSDILNVDGTSTGLRNRSVKRVKKQLAPDTTACIFWLKNRQTVDWRDRHEHTGGDGGPVKFLVEYEPERKTPKK